MLHHPLIDQLQQLKLSGMLAALEQQLSMSDRDQLSFDERLGLLLEHEMTVRANRRLQYRLQKAKLRQAACIEDIDYRHPRGLDKLLVQQLISCRWLDEHLNCLITGPTGVGKTWLACALAQQSCRQGYTAQYLRLPRLLRLPKKPLAKSPAAIRSPLQSSAPFTAPPHRAPSPSLRSVKALMSVIPSASLRR